jgi:hypothetical protein
MTAVEWLAEQLPIYGYNVVTMFPELIEQAKEMEKQQGYSKEEVIQLVSDWTDYRMSEDTKNKVKFKKWLELE